jgi:hypothetical protein
VKQPTDVDERCIIETYSRQEIDAGVDEALAIPTLPRMRSVRRTMDVRVLTGFILTPFRDYLGKDIYSTFA